MFAISNFEHNMRFDPDGFVLGQDTHPTSAMFYGLFPMGYNGCEVISVYNAMRLLGRPMPLSEVVRDFEKGLHPLLFGVFGTKPSRIGRFLKKKGFDVTKKYRLDKLSQLSHDGAVFIISFWTSPKLICTIHTIAVRCIASDKWEAYNLYNNTRSVRIKKSLADVIGDGRFICGYYVK